ncbi:hypothetical protein ACKFKF_07390 [Phormidesmis sp. 146-12]
MRLLNFCFTIGLITLGAKSFELLPANSQGETSPLSQAFVSVPIPDEAVKKPYQVLIYSATDVQTQTLVDRLATLKIPYQLTSSISQTLDADDHQGLDRFQQLKHEKQPIVFIYGKAKSNPRAEEVVTEYQKMTGELLIQK